VDKPATARIKRRIKARAVEKQTFYQFAGAKVALILCCTGLRPTELAQIKTAAGKNRLDAKRQAAVDGTKLALADMEQVGAFDESPAARRTPYLRNANGQCGRSEENSATDIRAQFAGRNK